tara:strand:- start:806 stop:919 length:114 start_codon:yes stop_codon:yes gene_type:complete
MATFGLSSKQDIKNLKNVKTTSDLIVLMQKQKKQSNK